ncbi:hypothetical protein HN937_16895, partial [Candidatus Poribacteria bacterium]|nr:hypothetical protein [Candidatus Poribacteria bacterium]
DPSDGAWLLFHQGSGPAGVDVNGHTSASSSSFMSHAPSPDGPWARISRHAEPLTHIELHGGALYGAQDYGVVLRADLDD